MTGITINRITFDFQPTDIPGGYYTTTGSTVNVEFSIHTPEFEAKTNKELTFEQYKSMTYHELALQLKDNFIGSVNK